MKTSGLEEITASPGPSTGPLFALPHTHIPSTCLIGDKEIHTGPTQDGMSKVALYLQINKNSQ